MRFAWQIAHRLSVVALGVEDRDRGDRLDLRGCTVGRGPDRLIRDIANLIRGTANDGGIHEPGGSNLPALARDPTMLTVAAFVGLERRGLSLALCGAVRRYRARSRIRRGQRRLHHRAQLLRGLRLGL